MFPGKASLPPAFPGLGRLHGVLLVGLLWSSKFPAPTHPLSTAFSPPAFTSEGRVHTQLGQGRSDLFPAQFQKLTCCSWRLLQPICTFHMGHTPTHTPQGAGSVRS